MNIGVADVCGLGTPIISCLLVRESQTDQMRSRYQQISPSSASTGATVSIRCKPCVAHFPGLFHIQPSPLASLKSGQGRRRCMRPVCIYLCMYVCSSMYVCMCVYVCMYLCMYVCSMYVCMYVCMYHGKAMKAVC